ncbi:hypothetical protein [Pseudoflavonifractor sp.]
MVHPLHLPLMHFNAPADYALRQWLNFIKAAPLRRFYEIARLPPRE